ncbi:MAG: hypothetical protein JNL82_22730 [Myxococcales bacterium]|nr:hypothetical protein [Myxococcales bacterium]
MTFLGAVAALALAAFWVNTLLIAAAGWRAYVELRRRYDPCLAPGTGLVRGAVTAGHGPDGALAALRVRQVGRTNGKGPLLLHDRAREGVVYGGAVAVRGGEAIALAPGTAAEVWLAGATRRRAAACPDGDTLAAARAAGVRAAGWEREVVVPLRVGDEIWLGGQVGSGRVLADFDPRGWRTRAGLWTLALVAGSLAAAAGCTLLALWPPVFGAVSKLGAFAALVVFNLLQLLGKLHAEAIRPPQAQGLGGAWKAR